MELHKFRERTLKVTAIILTTVFMLSGCGGAKKDTETKKEVAIYEWMFSDDCDYKKCKELLGSPDSTEETEVSGILYTTYQWDNYELFEGYTGNLMYVSNGRYPEYEGFKWVMSGTEEDYKALYDLLDSHYPDITIQNGDPSCSYFSLGEKGKRKNKEGGTYTEYYSCSMNFEDDYIRAAWGKGVVGISFDETEEYHKESKGASIRKFIFEDGKTTIDPIIEIAGDDFEKTENLNLTGYDWNNYKLYDDFDGHLLVVTLDGKITEIRWDIDPNMSEDLFVETVKEDCPEYVEATNINLGGDETYKRVIAFNVDGKAVVLFWQKDDPLNVSSRNIDYERYVERFAEETDAE